jgi:hypothetical protein
MYGAPHRAHRPTQCLAHPTLVQFASFEVPRAVYVDAQRFTAENCLLTASLKLCRGKLEKRYQAVPTPWHSTHS